MVKGLGGRIRGVVALEGISHSRIKRKMVGLILAYLHLSSFMTKLLEKNSISQVE